MSRLYRDFSIVNLILQIGTPKNALMINMINESLLDGFVCICKNLDKFSKTNNSPHEKKTDFLLVFTDKI